MPRLATWLVIGWLFSPLDPVNAEQALMPTFEAASQAPQASAQQKRWERQMGPKLARFVPSADLQDLILQRVYQEASLAGLPPSLILALIEVESAFEADAVSSAGAVGLMQIMPFWLEELGLAADNLKDPARNLRYGCTILAHYLAVENGDFTRALARYNGSLGKTWYPERVMHAWQQHWR
ncbi:lytic transglycosylase domain-containing protein [Vreelandella aquamarina]|uniref:lytic transglycosylase domain-containing protein n=1 Tax=Vreelandella aquamarina TaxID=77097 RepID=UPI00384D93AF